MKVAHFVTIDFGGAYRAAARISDAMQSEACESTLYCRTKNSVQNPGTEILHSSTQRFLSKVKNVGNLLFSSGEIVIDKFGTDICQKKEFKDADVIILHWVNSFISVTEIDRIAAQGKPVIWVMHDMWNFTGGCHYDRYCDRFKEECGACPILKSSNSHDRTYRECRKKYLHYRNKGIVFVSPSIWIQDCARQSMVLRGEQILRIRNPIPTDIYMPTDKKKAQEIWGIKTHKKVILFGAVKATENTQKGFHHLVGALNGLDKDQYMVVMFGNNDNVSDMCGFETKAVGVVKDEKKLSLLYNAADVFVAPSEQDNYPSTVAEALACSTPVTAFNIGGMPDMIVHKQNGYLADLNCPQTLADGIVYCAQHNEELGMYARKSVVENNAYEKVGREYRELCERMMRGKVWGMCK